MFPERFVPKNIFYNMAISEFFLCYNFIFMRDMMWRLSQMMYFIFNIYARGRERERERAEGAYVGKTKDKLIILPPVLISAGISVPFVLSYRQQNLCLHISLLNVCTSALHVLLNVKRTTNNNNHFAILHFIYKGATTIESELHQLKELQWFRIKSNFITIYFTALSWYLN
jgi:hypothetical protein